MNPNAVPGEVKPYAILSILAKLKRTGNRRYGRFDRKQIEELKLALAPHWLILCQRLLPYRGVLSRTGGYWVIPILEIAINLETGDFFPWPFEFSRRLGDFISLYGLVYNLPFRQAMAALSRIARETDTLPADGKSSSKENDREKRRIVCAALFGTSGPLSSLAIRRRVLAYLDAHPERYPKAKEEHPEFFSSTPFARLLGRWSALPEERQEFFRLRQRSEGKNILYFFF
jgi:hypothetical protein